MDTGIPSKIGRYTIDRLIGSGAMGFVFLGRDPELDRPVAVKTLRDLHMAQDALATFLERFRNEARAAARLQHASIVQVYDVGEDADVGPYLVFEYVPGSTLKQIIRSRGALPPAQLVGIAEQVADAIDTAHASDIIHRDIKPDNLLVTQEGRAKLADFGIARIPNAALTREGQFLGTPCYAAPETLRQGVYGPHTDLFSFAAMLYEATSGVRAFPGDDAVAVAHKVIHDEPLAPSEVARGTSIPADVDDVLLRALSKKPQERHGSATALVRALRDAFGRAGSLDVDPVGATMGTAPRPVSARHRPEPRRSGAVAFAAVLVGALAVGIAIVLAFNRGTTVAGDDLDAGWVDAGARTGPGDPGRATLAQPPRDADRSDAALVIGPAALDAGPSEGVPDPSQLTSHGREEMAKDLIERAERALARGDLEAARTAVEGARRFDPENPDIEALEARLAGR